MVSSSYYRNEAERCRKLAEAAKDPEIAAQWSKLARDYNALADSLEASAGPPPPPVHIPMQQQPVQQQQTQQQTMTEPEDKK
jgi:hypothetical protein